MNLGFLLAFKNGPGGVLFQNWFASMPKRSMPDVVQQNRKTYQSLVALRLNQCSGKSTGNMKRAQGMVKPRMCCTWVNQMGERQLMKRAETLKNFRVDDVSFMRVAIDEAMNRVANLKIVEHRVRLGKDMLKVN